MAKQADHYRAIPQTIYIVSVEKSFRIYTAEGHAQNQFNKHVTAGLKPSLIKYEMTTTEK